MYALLVWFWMCALGFFLVLSFKFDNMICFSFGWWIKPSQYYLPSCVCLEIYGAQCLLYRMFFGSYFCVDVLQWRFAVIYFSSFRPCKFTLILLKSTIIPLTLCWSKLIRYIFFKNKTPKMKLDIFFLLISLPCILFWLLDWVFFFLL